MREALWFLLRKSKFLRRLSSLSLLAKPLRSASLLLMPSARRKMMRVRAGLGKGLLLELKPRWHAAIVEGENETEICEILAQHLGQGTNFYDVGGGIGFYSLVAARLGANVWVFEPAPSNAAMILNHARKNELQDRIRIIPSAVFSHTGVLSLRSNERETGYANFHVESGDQAGPQLPSVSCTTLDDFIQDNPVPDFLKIDVEWAELEALKGAKSLLQTFRPPLVCEIHDATLATDVTRWLGEIGYQIRWLTNVDVFPCYLYASAKS